MPITVTKADGVTVFTMTPNPKSRCPLLCQILGTLCCSPFCMVSRSLKQQLGKSHTVLGALQILVGVLNLGFVGIIRFLDLYSVLWGLGFGLGAMFIAAGIGCILVEKFPSPCLIGFSILLNVFSIGMAITGIVFYSMDLTYLPLSNNCKKVYGYGNGYGYGHGDTYGDRYPYYKTTTASPTINDVIKNCERYFFMFKVIFGGLNIIMIMSSILEICFTISSCVLYVKALCKKNKEDHMEDSELQKPLVEEVLSSPAC
ncbi:uncharacterized protein LOC111192132 [Astyanax mexicanus]|uniref:uncharacterized protein LOC111192132 n=1 Tax=Astyanax mexicanus TaxID=7994 RepID=UPI0020CAC101|nr:uncharacterized protein LOC111192132 [Astyanax mexicanus]